MINIVYLLNLAEMKFVRAMMTRESVFGNYYNVGSYAIQA